MSLWDKLKTKIPYWACGSKKAGTLCKYRKFNPVRCSIKHKIAHSIILGNFWREHDIKCPNYR